ncbi:hypothetical protein [Deinococcus aerophilus]|uniref:Uncharacterized protein n=1 Tax=Deinococcus aerophilus TaxID=522488 RepID=A0ABQ2GXN0_9DEIO|nr:hypothetical protein [Deinococcus aerophilus]GGM16886.1 hypothetical protein GCM10010841_26490 [Deinococcus aerophilus]
MTPSEQNVRFRVLAATCALSASMTAVLSSALEVPYLLRAAGVLLALAIVLLGLAHRSASSKE